MSARARTPDTPTDPQGRPVDPLRADLSALYALSQGSSCVFASPLGPFAVGGGKAHLDRFVFFGPNASDDSWRIAFYAGFDRKDVRASRALVAFLRRLVSNAEAGHALNLSFFPLIDSVQAVSAGPPRNLGLVHWGRAADPEIVLLEKDARLRGYHGFVRVETAEATEDSIGIRIRGPVSEASSPDLELITSEETRSFPVSFEAGEYPVAFGPLSIADDLPYSPFELTLRIPGHWTDDAYRHAVVTLLERFVRRYRAFQAYGQHL